MALRAAVRRPRVPMIDRVSLDLDKLKSLRIQQSLSFEQAAKAAGFANRQRWYEIESGTKMNITLDTLDKLAHALGVKAKDLLK
jgi:transcriptional regulator with XRE-family HTH domain